MIPSSHNHLVAHLGTPRPVRPPPLHLGPEIPPALTARGACDADVEFSDLPLVDGEETRAGDGNSTGAISHMKRKWRTLFPGAATGAKEFCS